MKEIALYIIILCPLVGCVLQLLVGAKLPKVWSGGFACCAILLSFLGSAYLFMSFEQGFSLAWLPWFQVGELQTALSFRIDELSLIMMLVVSGISFLIHVYSLGYMKEDPLYSRYFAYLNLFVCAMLILVTADNLLLMFVGWEGVGLCSYLLIGFWFEDEFKAFCGKKAFIVNRIGDAGFLLAIFLSFSLFGSLSFDVLSSKAAALSAELNFGILSLLTLCLFLGAMGKSAQFPLYVWLPDAMAGPTSVSALIHAATMVTAGVYMICRLHFFYDLTPIIQKVVVIIGAFTALLSALMALTQRDIKKVLAYSTVSQLGYMFVGAGLAAYGTAMFHLTTHAFFKALLFLGSGSVIHAMHGEQDIFKMGGLKNVMPLTYLTFFVGSCALAGIPPFAGFFSKDSILAYAFEASPYLWGVLGVTAVLTSFYIFRTFYLTFHGSLRNKNAHESDNSMVLPLVLLAVGSLVIGFIGLPQNFAHLFHASNLFEKFLAPSKHLTLSQGLEWGIMFLSVLGALLSAYVAYVFYVRGTSVLETMSARMSFFYKLSYNKFYVDEAYDALFIRPLKKTADFLWRIIDVVFIDGIVNGVAWFGRQSFLFLSLFQSGKVGNYAFVMFVGALIVIILLAHFR
ncbi:MAG: NADH-quinone oxidoreductase subunit L [Deltaproteobacteria bacterium]|nr:NADH-quinone oxidoreductase subunit L [Deltaproteobacteria bacterium]